MAVYFHFKVRNKAKNNLTIFLTNNFHVQHRCGVFHLSRKENSCNHPMAMREYSSDCLRCNIMKMTKLGEKKKKVEKIPKIKFITCRWKARQMDRQGDSSMNKMRKIHTNDSYLVVHLFKKKKTTPLEDPNIRHPHYLLWLVWRMIAHQPKTNQQNNWNTFCFYFKAP